MRLPLPREQLAGCVWLPRILAKARRLQHGELPPEYVANFCHPKGVDGLFIMHFGLSRDDVVAAAARPDAEVAQWFLSRTPNAQNCIQKWNETASNLGRPGYPLADRFPAALATVYKNVAGRGLTTVFEVLEADEESA